MAWKHVREDLFLSGQPRFMIIWYSPPPSSPNVGGPPTSAHAVWEAVTKFCKVLKTFYKVNHAPVWPK